MKIFVDQETAPPLKLMIYGEPGVGKTSFAASAEDHPLLKNVLIADVEGGLLSVRKRKLPSVRIGKNDDGSNNGRVLEDLEELAWNLIQKKPGYEKFNTVVIDSVTEIQAKDLENIVADNIKRFPNKESNKNRTVDQIFQEDYGLNTTRMRRVFRLFRDSPLNVICTALVSEKKNSPPRGQEARTLEVRPFLTEKSADSIMGYMDHVWYMHKDDNDKRTILTQRKGVYQAKTRIDSDKEVIPAIVTNPNLPDLYNQMLNALKETK
jgi:hypothetical protein